MDLAEYLLKHTGEHLVLTWGSREENVICIDVQRGDALFVLLRIPEGTPQGEPFWEPISGIVNVRQGHPQS